MLERRKAQVRTLRLLLPELERQNVGETIQRDERSVPPAKNGGLLEPFLRQADLRLPAWTLCFFAFGLGSSSVALFSVILSPWCLPLVFALGCAVPFAWVESRVRKRSLEFARDYPTMLLAAASSVKVGMTPYQALERSTRLLPKVSLVRVEVETLLKDLRAGTSREVAVKQFGRSIRQPDLELFRSAFILVLENGGRFAPTLSRLAAVSNNRAVLIRSAGVSTASMRMTANVLLVMAPVLLLVVSSRTNGFWTTFLTHPTANFLGSAGIVLIIGCYAILRHMSNFKP